MGSVDDAPSGTALTSARRPCLHFHCAFWFTRQRARAHVALLGPCFKTGRTRPSEYQQHWRTSDALRPEIAATISTARSPHRTVHSDREAPPYGVHHHGQGLPFFLGRTGAPNGRAISCQREQAHADSPSAAALWLRSNRRWSVFTRSTAPPRANATGPSRSTRRHPRRCLNLRDHCTNLVRFPPDGFTYCLTLFSKCFSSFPHGTCSLSVSCQYLALDGVYHPFWAAISNNPTLRAQILPPAVPPRTGLSPSPARLSRTTLGTPPRAKLALQTTIRRCGHRRFQI